jgi:hypothetical protein
VYLLKLDDYSKEVRATEKGSMVLLRSSNPEQGMSAGGHDPTSLPNARTSGSADCGHA